MFATRSLWFVSALAVLAPLAGQDGTQLRWQFNVGDVLRYRVTMDQSIEMSGMADHTTNNQVIAVLREDVKEVAADGTASIEFRYEAMRFAMNMGSPVTFDSTLTGEDAKKNDPDLAKAIGPMLEAKLHMKFASNGRVSEISGVKEMLELAVKGLARDGTGQMLEGMFSEDSTQQRLEANVFPDKALVAGDTWQRTREQKAPALGTMKTVIDNEFVGLEQHGGIACAKIVLTEKLSIESDDSSDESVQVSLVGSKGEGTLWFDPQRGRMVESTLLTDLHMALGAPPEDESEDDTRMTITTGISVRMLLLAKDAPAFEPAAK